MIATTNDGRKVLLRTDNTWEFVDKTADSAPSVNFEAAVVFRNGDVVPVARTEFYLLDRDISKDLQTSEIKQIKINDINDKINSEGLRKQLVEDVETATLRSVFLDYYLSLYPAYSKEVGKVIKNSAKFQTTSDFKGKSSFTNVTPGKYYLLGVTKLRSAYIVWYLPIEIDNKTINLILDSNNTL